MIFYWKNFILYSKKAAGYLLFILGYAYFSLIFDVG